jgi:hypothetical protein
MVSVEASLFGARMRDEPECSRQRATAAFAAPMRDG